MTSEDPKDRFYRQFKISVASIEEQISSLPSFSSVGGERQYAVEHVLSSISRLSNDVADASAFLPAYDQRTYSDKVKELRDEVAKAQAQFTPKARFQFKRRPTDGAGAGAGTSAGARLDSRRPNPVGRVDAAAPPAEPKARDTLGSLPTAATGTAGVVAKNYNAEIASGSGVRKPSFSAARDIALSDHQRMHITLPVSAARATSAGTLTNLDRCVVDMSAPTTSGSAHGAPFASLALKDIAGSVIVAGHVDGPVHVTNVRDSAIMVAARQVRIHDCDNVVFYLHCASRPIIEGCKGVRFGKTPEGYLTEQEKKTPNLYDQVDDFKWLKATESPNWSLLPEPEAIPESVWKKALAPGPGVVIEDTLHALGVGKSSGA
ncbi:hypothetical protein VTJ83DRAFT_3182 [Remersonia thermophila]|uniref:C-CAP/cofactor C-like domain-containing protein n=1 Tax=Remersonia thermophila TaxID=72144 RepID=A0ABR4DDC0_9PEZI